MAGVYKAKCHLLNRFVAVKILRADEFGGGVVKRKAAREDVPFIHGHTSEKYLYHYKLVI